MLPNLSRTFVFFSLTNLHDLFFAKTMTHVCYAHSGGEWHHGRGTVSSMPRSRVGYHNWRFRCWVCSCTISRRRNKGRGRLVQVLSDVRGKGKNEKRVIYLGHWPLHRTHKYWMPEEAISTNIKHQCVVLSCQFHTQMIPDCNLSISGRQLWPVRPKRGNRQP